MSRPMHTVQGMVVRSSENRRRALGARSVCWLALATLATGCATMGEGAPSAARPTPSVPSNAADGSAPSAQAPSRPSGSEALASTEAGAAGAGASAKLEDLVDGHALKAKSGNGSPKAARAPSDEGVPTGGSLGSVPSASGAKGRRLFAPIGLVKILDKPDRDAPVIGAFRNGQSVLLREGERPVTQRRLYQCAEAWYPVQPRGWACVGGPGHATFDGNDLAVKAAVEAMPDLSQSYPFHFGSSVGTPRYLRIPTAAEQRQAEPDLDQYLAKLPADAQKGGAIDTKPAGHGPPEALTAYFAQANPPLTSPDAAYDGMKVSWTKEFDANGRTWLLTPTFELLPKDRVRQQPLPSMRGVDLKNNPEMHLPLAFTWLEDAVKYRQDDKGEIVATNEKWSRHSFVPATGGMVKGDHGRWYWEMRDGSLAYYPDVTIIKAAGRLAGVGPNEKWVHVRVTWGWMVAYEGGTPVYATAISPGIDGISARAHATAKGKQHVKWKMLSSDMSGRDKGKDWFVDEVPWTQYYRGNFAIHGAWWHDDFGRPKSHGCINVPPADAMWLFQWMDPQMPEGWYAVSPYSPVAKSTLIYIQY
jgi:hypothetical protein